MPSLATWVPATLCRAYLKHTLPGEGRGGGGAKPISGSQLTRTNRGGRPQCAGRPSLCVLSSADGQRPQWPGDSLHAHPRSGAGGDGLGTAGPVYPSRLSKDQHEQPNQQTSSSANLSRPPKQSHAHAHGHTPSYTHSLGSRYTLTVSLPRIFPPNTHTHVDNTFGGVRWLIDCEPSACAPH